MLVARRCASCGERLPKVSVVRLSEALTGPNLFCQKCLTESREEDSRRTVAVSEAKAAPDIVLGKERDPQPAGDVNESLRRWQ